MFDSDTIKKKKLVICYTIFTFLYVCIFLGIVLYVLYNNTTNTQALFVNDDTGTLMQFPFCMNKFIFGIYCLVSIALIIGEIIYNITYNEKWSDIGAAICDLLSCVCLLGLFIMLFMATIAADAPNPWKNNNIWLKVIIIVGLVSKFLASIFIWVSIAEHNS